MQLSIYNQPKNLEIISAQKRVGTLHLKRMRIMVNWLIDSTQHLTANGGFEECKYILMEIDEPCGAQTALTTVLLFHAFAISGVKEEVLSWTWAWRSPQVCRACFSWCELPSEAQSALSICMLRSVRRHSCWFPFSIPFLISMDPHGLLRRFTLTNT